MSSKARKRVNAACRAGSNGALLRVLPSFLANVPDLLGLGPHRVPTPSGCEGCMYREPDMRDGGWCYMFKEPPRPICAQFRRELCIASPAPGDTPKDAKD